MSSILKILFFSPRETIIYKTIGVKNDVNININTYKINNLILYYTLL